MPDRQADHSGKRMLFAHGIQARYGDVRPGAVEGYARQIAQSRGYKDIYPISGAGSAKEERAAIRRALHEQSDIGGVLGFSRGGNLLRQMLRDPGIPESEKKNISEAILVGSPETHGDIPGIPTIDIPYLKNVGHMRMLESLSKTGTLDPHRIQASKEHNPYDFKVEPIEMTTIGQWISWRGDISDINSVMTPVSASPSPSPSGDTAGSSSAGGGSASAFVDRRLIDRALGPPGGDTRTWTGGEARIPRLARARTPYHSTHQFPKQAEGRARTPYHDTHPGISSGTTGEIAGSSGTLAQQRSRFRTELQQKPRLKEKILGISVGENKDSRANLSVMESMMNRAAMRGHTLEQESYLHRTAPGFKTAPYQRGGHVSGYYAGYRPQDLGRYRGMAEANLERALSGSNVSNYATGNASGKFARGRLAKGTYPGGLRKLYHGEYFVGEGNRGTGPGSYAGWLSGTKAGEATGGTGPTGGAGGGFGGRGHRTNLPYPSGSAYSGPAHDAKFSINPRVQRSGYNKALASAGEEASRHLPEGWRAEAMSGYRPGSHGMHGRNKAMDFALYPPGSKTRLPWYQSPQAFGQYERFHQDVHRALPPAERSKHRWGGYFGDVRGRHVYGSMDLMHSDLGGPGRMAAGGWRGGLTPGYRRHWGISDSHGMDED